MEEFQLTPSEWTVAADEEIAVNLVNDGTIDHEWVTLRPGVAIEREADLPETEEERLADFVSWEDGPDGPGAQVSVVEEGAHSGELVNEGVIAHNVTVDGVVKFP